MLDFIVNRLKEPSTWRGVVGIATAAGVALNPEQVAAIVAAGVGIAGLIAVFTKDSGSEDKA